MRVKYPRTLHLPWSSGTDDDKRCNSDDHLLNKNVVVTLKLDGENTTMYNDYIHARSVHNDDHESRDFVKGIWGSIKYLLPEGMRVCGENMYALHTIAYDALKSYFYVFNIWMEDECISWSECKEYCKELGLVHAPVIYEGVYNKETILEEWKKYEETHEGYVVRVDHSFTRSLFKDNVAKYVKPQFRQTLKESTVHWKTAKVIPNKLHEDKQTESPT